VIASAQRTYPEDPEVLPWSRFCRPAIESMRVLSIRRWEGTAWSFCSHSGSSGEKALAFFRLWIWVSNRGRGERSGGFCGIRPLCSAPGSAPAETLDHLSKGPHPGQPGQDRNILDSMGWFAMVFWADFVL